MKSVNGKNVRGYSNLAVAAATLLGTLVTGPASAALTDGLMGYWDFNDGTAHDQSGNGLNGTPSDVTAVGGVSGGAFEFNGSTSAVSLGNSVLLDPPGPGLTLAGWVKPVEFNGHGSEPIIEKGYYSHSAPYYQYSLQVIGNRSGFVHQFSFFAAFANHEEAADSPDNTWTPGSWYFVVGTFDGANLRLFVNGVLVATTPNAFPLISFPGSQANLGHYTNLPFGLPGTLDEIRVYKRALKPQEIRSLYSHPAGNGPMLSGSILLQDYQGSVTGAPVSLEIENGSYSETTSTELDQTGGFSTPIDAPDGTYTIYAKSSHWLRKAVGSVSVSGGAASVSISLANGDCNDDNAVDIGDYSLLSAAYGSSPGAGNWEPNADLNGDEAVDIGDYSILSANYGLSGD